MDPNSKCLNVCLAIERLLSEFYKFDLTASCVNHFTSREELISALGSSIKGLSEWNSRAAVWTNCWDESEFFIGIHVDHAIWDVFEKTNPFDALEDTNIDAFCVLVEELSHFHMILNRIVNHKQISRLELEWHGEIDKFIITNLWLRLVLNIKSSMDLSALSNAKNIASTDDRIWLYDAASKFAVKFLQKRLSRTDRSNWKKLVDLRIELIEIYRIPGANKILKKVA